MAGIFNKRNAGTAAATLVGMPDDDTAEQLAKLDCEQLQRLAERLGLHVTGTAAEMRAALRSLVEQPCAPMTGSRLVH